MMLDNLHNILDKLFPFSDSEEWDNSGYFNYQNNLDIKNIVVSLDVTFDVLDFAIKNNANLIITHHPIYIDESNLKMSWMKKMISKIIYNNITILSLHTNYDKAKKGMNYQILKRLNLKNIYKSDSSNYLFIGNLKEKVQLDKFLLIVKEKLNLNYLLVNSSDNKLMFNKKIKKVCVVAGAGSNELYSIKAKDKIDLFLTGEVKWHLWEHSNNKNISIVDIGHIGEKIFINHICNVLRKYNINVFKLEPSNIKII